MNEEYKIGDFIKLKINGCKAMVVADVPLGMMGVYPMYDVGYIIRMENNLQELYVRHHEVEKWI